MTERQIQLLEILAKYRYLTSEHIKNIFGLKTNKTPNTLLKDLKERKNPLVDFKDFGVMVPYGRLPRMFFLTKHGKNFLVENLDYEPEKIKAVQNKHSMFIRDYFHRCSTIEFNIKFYEWAEKNGYEVDFFNAYYDKTGSNRNGSEVIENSIMVGGGKIIPDGIGVFRDHTRPYIFAFEQHNGKDAKRAIEQILGHCMAISEGAISEKYNIKRANRVYYVFEDLGCLKSVIETLTKDKSFFNFSDLFLFKTEGSLAEDFFTNWVDINGQTRSFI